MLALADEDVLGNLYGEGPNTDDLPISMAAGVRQNGRQVLAETNHRDLLCARIAHGAKGSRRLPDGTLFVDESDFDAISGLVRINWYWSGPEGSGEKHAQWRCYSPPQIVDLLQRAGLRFTGAYKGLSRTAYKVEGSEAGGRLAIVALRED